MTEQEHMNFCIKKAIIQSNIDDEQKKIEDARIKIAEYQQQLDDIEKEEN